MAAAKQAKLFDQMSTESTGYSAKDIEVLEGLEPVRKRPGMYIGGTDERAYHHLFAEVLDNSMDEAVAGHASRIEIKLDADGFLAVSDNGRTLFNHFTIALRHVARKYWCIGVARNVDKRCADGAHGHRAVFKHR